MDASVILALTTLEPAEFARLEADLETELATQRQDRRHDGLARQRAFGAGGETSKLPTPASKLLFTLFYYRCYPLQEVIAFLFGMSQPQACEWIKRLTPVVGAVLKRELRLPARRPANLDTLLEETPELSALIVDGAEHRACQSKEQRMNAVGKRASRKYRLVSGGRRAVYVRLIKRGRVQDTQQTEALDLT